MRAHAAERRIGDQRDEVLEYERAKRRRQRQEVLAHYGGRCACCGEERYEFLSIDHINGGGRKHRASSGSSKLSELLRREGYPEGYRVLCHNCNQSIGAYGYCPHEYERTQ